MKLKFEDYLSAKMSMGVQLMVYPDGKAEDFLTERQEKTGGESAATLSEYDFPDHTVVVARMETGSAVMMPDEPVDVSIEVHIGSAASLNTIEIAVRFAKGLALDAGIDIEAAEFLDVPPFGIIRH